MEGGSDMPASVVRTAGACKRALDADAGGGSALDEAGGAAPDCARSFERTRA
jgi:hypothetical protein